MSRRSTDSASASCPDLTRHGAAAPARRKPWLALGLAALVVATSIATGSLWHALPERIAGGGSFGWPALEAGRWWTLATSLVLTRDAFMAVTMALAVAVGLGLYERLVGPGRALGVALVGHVTGSVVVALGAGALGRTGWPVAVRAAGNLDYGASMVVAAALGALASRTRDRHLLRLALFGPLVILLLHHQLADWAHLMACPAGYLVDGARRPRPAAVAALVTATVTGSLVLYGPEAVVATTNEIRFSTISHGIATVGRSQIVHLDYTARALGDRPEVATLYVPAHLDTIVRDTGHLPVVLFLHGIPGESEDWLAGGGLAGRLDADIAAGRFPAALAVLPESDGVHDPKAGWVDEPHQPVLTSLRDDLLPALARRYPAVDLDPGHVAVVGVGRGGDGALRLAGLDPRFGFAVAIEPSPGAAPGPGPSGTASSGTASSGAPPSGPDRIVIPQPPFAGTATAARWARWRADLPTALSDLVGAGFGRASPRG